jgi:hypothetical protein
MPVGPRSPARFRRRIFVGGVLAAGALYSVGAPIFARRIEADLEQRVPAALADAGFDGVRAAFSGQDGTLRCRAALDDPERAAAIAYDVRGVRAITVERTCRINAARDELSDDGTSDGTLAAASTTIDVTTTSTTPATIATVAPRQPGTVTVAIDGGVVTLTGVVGSEVERARLRNAAALAVPPEQVVDQLTVDASRALGDEVGGSLVQLIAVAAGNLTSGSVAFDGEGFDVEGEYLTAENADQVEGAVDAAGATADLVQAPPTTTLETEP